MSEQLAIFISGGGSNARRIIEHFHEGEGRDLGVKVALVISSSREAGGLLMAAEHDVPTLVLDRQVFRQTDDLLDILADFGVTFIALAGFLWLVPAYLIRAYPASIVNIHPALLPKFGGKGMYGANVHRAVKAAGESESGPTIHWVNEHYDEGGIIFQASAPLLPEDSAEDIAAKVLSLEHRHYPAVIEKLLEER
jgi:phosphoribosylglycinamide formyltransferase-1